MPVNVPVPQRPRTPFERATEAAIAYAEADDDDDFLRARDNLRKSIAACAPSMRDDLRRELISKLTRLALDALKARGVKLGRPSKVHPAVAEKTVEEAGGVRKAAAVLQVSVWTIRRALRRGQKGIDSAPGR